MSGLYSVSMVSINQANWDLHRTGQRDQERHKEKIKEAIRDNLPEIISQADIITSDGATVTKVPIRSLNEYKFRYDPDKGNHIGQGPGGSQPGDVLGRVNDGTGNNSGPGEEPGVDYFEAEVSIEELEEVLFADLELPNLEAKKQPHIPVPKYRFTEIRKTGIFSNLDKRRTIKENIKRNALAGRQPKLKKVDRGDLRFRSWEEIVTPESNAVVIAMMDVSGSMGTFEKYIARVFCFWAVRFLRTKYDNVSIVFITHHTEAEEVTEHEFFTKGESGGTRVSSAYQLAQEIVAARFNLEEWNVYPFHISDGDNMLGDNKDCVQRIWELLEFSNQFAYVQIVQDRPPAHDLFSLYQARFYGEEKFVATRIDTREDVYTALCQCFSSKVTEHYLV